MKMTVDKAHRILHPETSFEALLEIAYKAGFRAEEARTDAVEEACLVACESLEKQMPKKILKECDKDVKSYWCSCPTCNKGLGWEHGDHPTYCSECGQKLNWED